MSLTNPTTCNWYPPYSNPDIEDGTRVSVVVVLKKDEKSISAFWFQEYMSHSGFFMMLHDRPIEIDNKEILGWCILPEWNKKFEKHKNSDKVKFHKMMPK